MSFLNFFERLKDLALKILTPTTGSESSGGNGSINIAQTGNGNSVNFNKKTERVCEKCKSYFGFINSEKCPSCGSDLE